MNYPNVTRQLIESFAPCPAWTDTPGGYVEVYPDMDETWPDFFDLPSITDEHKVWMFTRDIPEIHSQQQAVLESFTSKYITENDSLLCQEVKSFHSKVLDSSSTDDDIKEIEGHVTHSEPKCENYEENYKAYRLIMCLRLGAFTGINALKDSSNYSEILMIAKNLDWGA